jgi:hypothetical protein
MKFDIKSRLTGETIYTVEADTLALAIEAAVDLSRADFSWANLSGAALSRFCGFALNPTTPLRILLDQPGKIRAYKLVKSDGEAPFNGGIHYDLDKSYQVEDANTDETVQCAAGINVATLDWCRKNWQVGWRILVVEFEAKDIAAIPISTDGKFRLHRCKIVGERLYE